MTQQEARHEASPSPHRRACPTAHSSPAAIDSIAGAYFSTLVYGIAPTLLSDASLRSRSSTLLSITLMLGLYLGLGCSIGLSKKLETIVR